MRERSALIRHFYPTHANVDPVARKPMCWQCAVVPCCDYMPKTPLPA